MGHPAHQTHVRNLQRCDGRHGAAYPDARAQAVHLHTHLGLYSCGYTAEARLKQQLGELPPVTTIARDPAEDRQRLEEQLQQALTRTDYTAAAELKQKHDKQPLVKFVSKPPCYEGPS